MKLSKDEINEVMEIQKRLEAKIAAHQKEIKQLEKNWEILDRAVTESSFTSAADLLGQQAEDSPQENYEDAKPTHENYENIQKPTQENYENVQEDSQHAALDSAPPDTPDRGNFLPTEIKDKGTGVTIANAYRTDDHISIIMSDDHSDMQNMTADVEPFGSFFLERILGGMQKKDAEDIQNNAIPAGSALDYDVESDPQTGRIRSITIRNYRDERRATEIISTAGWSFSRMLERVAAATTT